MHLIDTNNGANNEIIRIIRQGFTSVTQGA